MSYAKGKYLQPDMVIQEDNSIEDVYGVIGEVTGPVKAYSGGYNYRVPVKVLRGRDEGKETTLSIRAMNGYVRLWDDWKASEWPNPPSRSD